MACCGLVQPLSCHISRVASARGGKVPWRRARAVRPGQMLVGVFGVGDGFFGYETVEHLPQCDRCVVGPDDGGGPLDYRRPGDASFHGAGCCVGWAAGPVVGVG